MKVAVIGSGISGLAAAHRLNGLADITLLEAGDYFGGHTHTVDITLDTSTGPHTHGVDTGFLVFNDRTYPQLIALFAELGVPSADSDMSFSVQPAGSWEDPALEWCGTSLDGVFAQRSNLLRPRFWRMLADVVRFNKLATGLALRNADAELVQPLANFCANTVFRKSSRIGISCPCWPVFGAAPLTRCWPSRSPPWCAFAITTA
jgi:predicted NAD/FAD-binding protein